MRVGGKMLTRISHIEAARQPLEFDQLRRESAKTIRLIDDRSKPGDQFFFVVRQAVRLNIAHAIRSDIDVSIQRQIRTEQPFHDERQEWRSIGVPGITHHR